MKLMQRWFPYLEYFPGPDHTVTGSLFICPNVKSRQLGNERAVTVYLPPSYSKGSRDYPTLYMMDGQNLFDVVRAH